MSRDSQIAFYRALENYRQELAAEPNADPAELVAAARTHRDDSPPLGSLVDAYEEAMAVPHASGAGAAQAIADELAPVRMATEIAGGNLPFRGASVSTGGSN